MPPKPRVCPGDCALAMIIALAGLTAAGCVGGPATDRRGGDEPSPEAATTVGRQACAACHEEQAASWRGSHHDLAMQVADEETILGDFDGATFTHFGVTSTFFKRDEKFLVRTDGPDGALQEYEIAYTFGVIPLQQYLIEFPGGRYQVLSVSWDSRPAAEGGQRWFHLYPGEPIPHDDILHWTGPNQNWNFMCAECHSTNLRKNYRPQEDRYQTTWSEIDVSCEACHGPGSHHVLWAEAGGSGTGGGEGSRAAGDADDSAGGGGHDGDKGLVVRLKDRDGGAWIMDPDTGVARRRPERRSRSELETCARCHSRRSVLRDDHVHGRPLMDTHRLALLDEALYYPDGQIKEEVYVHASFLQSKMYREGVTCSDCHDPHSLRLRGSGNGVCAPCHMPAMYDRPTHHHHASGSPGSRCVECHMPATTYMVVDPRRDHSLRNPRPDLSVKLGVPNPCNACHTDRTAQWATGTISKWKGPGWKPAPHYGEALHAGQHARADARQRLERLAADPTSPGIARASALWLLPPYAGPGSIPTIRGALGDDDPLVRAAAARATEVIEPRHRLPMTFPLLSDPILGVRLEAARVLASVPRALIRDDQRVILDRALGEYREAQMANADRGEAHLSLGSLHAQLGDLDGAEDAYERALRLEPSFVAAYVNLADLHRLQGREADGERVLREALEIAPDDADVHHALGLLFVRQRRLDEALAALERATELRPDLPRYSYVLGVALKDGGRMDRALAVLRAAHERHPGHRDLLVALATFNRERGDLDEATRYATKLLELSPTDPSVRRLVEELRGQRP